MKKILTFKIMAFAVIIGTFLTAFSMFGLTTSYADEESYSAEDWKPFNYVLTEGAGSNTRYLDIRTSLDYSGNKLMCSGTSTKGGMGVTFVPEIDITNFEMDVDLNSWQVASADRWFGFTLTDVLVKNDKFNEVPFYSKHSESWSNDYGAGTLFAVRPKTNGEMTIQFNYIGIFPSYNADGGLSSMAGDYDDGFLGWAGYISDIQLYNTNWELKTDYKNIKLSMKGIYEGETLVGVAFEINDGYWKRTDWNWPTPANAALGLSKSELTGILADDVFAMLDLDENEYLSVAECDNFTHGHAWNDGQDKNSIIPYANYGDSFYSLVKYQEKLKNAGKRLYLSYMYKDAFDIRQGSQPASFTINTVNGKPATKSETINLTAEKTVNGDISATVKEENLHAGVYPSMVSSFKTVEAEAKSYSSAKGDVDTIKATEKNVKVVHFKGVVDNKDVAIISDLSMTLDVSKLGISKIYKVNGKNTEEVEINGNIATIVGTSADCFVIVESGNTSKARGCKSAISATNLAIFAVLAAGLLSIKKKERK